jgi:hypothetical protein
MPLGALKPKACKGCGQMFQPWSGFTKTCSPTCALKYTREKADKLLAKQIRSEKMEMRARLMTRSDWLKRAQTAFNAWIRIRDRGQPCISCGCTLENRKVDAGHYRTVGAMAALRFEPLNCHSQCVPCNQHRSGNILEYRLGLIKRIGLEKVEWLEKDHPPKKYTIEQAQEIERQYKALCKAIEN